MSIFSKLKEKIVGLPIDPNVTPYEEISEKKTTKIGYFLLLIMAIFIVTIGQSVFSDLAKIPSVSQSISYCAGQFNTLVNPGGISYSSTYDYYNSYNSDIYSPEKCSFSKYEITHHIDRTILSAQANLQGYKKLNEEISDLQNELSGLQSQRQRDVSDYNLSLQEKQAGVKAAFDTTTSQNNLTLLDSEISNIQSKIDQKKTESESYLSKIKQSAPDFATQYADAQSDRNTAMNWYNIFEFILSMLFVLPFFIISMRYYFRMKRINSPYTIIAGAVFLASSILFIQKVFVLIYDIIPHSLIELLARLFATLAVFRFILWYLVVILVIAIFGGIVYYIQKKVYNKEAVAMRSLKDRKCPVCSFGISDKMNFCPKCNHQLLEDCGSCHQKTFKDLPVCYSCGIKKVIPLPVQK